MKRNSRNGGPDPRDPALSALAEPGEAWLELVRAAERPRAPGRIGPYELHGEVRAGAQGLVFRALQPGTGREIALKRLAAGAFSTPAERQRFEREVELAASLSHPSIVTIHGVEEVDGVPLLAMEWVDGEPVTTWAARLGQDGAATREKLRLFEEVCAAVQHAHQRGVIHRDLKPSNVLVDADGRCRVLDFGLARRLPGGVADAEAGGSAPGSATRTVGFVGTPAYAGPELFADDAAPLDVRSDVYSLGVVLYELLTGRRPFEARTLKALLDEVLYRDPPRPSALARGIDRELDAIVARALAKDPAERYPTVHALAEDVARYLAGRPVQAVPPSLRYAVATWVRRHRVVSVLSLLLALLSLVSLGVGAWQAQRIADERDRAELALHGLEEEQAKVVAAHDALADALAVTRSERDKARLVQDFYLDTIYADMEETGFGAETSVLSVIESLGATARERFADHPDVAAEAISQVARTLVLLERHDSALRLADEGLAVQAGDPLLVPGTRAMLLQTRGEALFGLQRLDEARPLLEQAVEIYARLPSLPMSFSAALASLGRFELTRGNPAPAADCYREACRVLDAIPAEERRADHWRNRAAMVGGLGRALLQLGEIAEAEVLLLDMLERAAEVRLAGALYVELYRPLIEVCLARDAREEAAAHAEACAAILRDARQSERESWASSCFGTAVALRMHAAFEPALRTLVAGESLAPEPATLARLQRARAEVLYQLGRGPESDALYAVAARSILEHLRPDDPARVEVLVEHLRVRIEAGEELRAVELFPSVLSELSTYIAQGGVLRPGCLKVLGLCAERLERGADLDATLTAAGLR